MSTRESKLKQISMTVEWSGDLRDIFVNCNSVSANAVVSISGNLLFQHVHLQEGNVYDFFLWVSETPRRLQCHHEMGQQRLHVAISCQPPHGPL